MVQLSDDLSEMPDDDILAFSSEISEPDENEKAARAPKPVPTPKKKPTEVAELDDYSSILAYTQEIKETNGIEDSYTQGKTDTDRQED